MANRDQYIDSIKVLNERLIAQLDDDKSKVWERRARARDELVQCDIDDGLIEEKRNSILQAQEMQLSYLGSIPAPPEKIDPPSAPIPPLPRPAVPMPPLPVTAAPPPPVPTSPTHVAETVVVQKRARIGPQRYFILTSLRDVGHLTLSEIIIRTGLVERRIRDQLRSDIGDGVVDEVLIGTLSKYRLTNSGVELLARFERYRNSSGKGLPTREEAISDSRQESASIFG